MAARTTPLVSPSTYWSGSGDAVPISTIDEYVNVLGFLAGHRFDDLWNNFNPGDQLEDAWKTGSVALPQFNLSTRNCHSLTLAISVLQYEFPNDLFLVTISFWSNTVHSNAQSFLATSINHAINPYVIILCYGYCSFRDTFRRCSGSCHLAP